MHDHPARDVIGEVESALDALRKGQMLVVVDDESRENEGDLVIAAEWADARAINFMATFGRGLICLALTEERAAELRLADQRTSGKAGRRTRFNRRASKRSLASRLASPPRIAQEPSR